jgi:exopolysaccharide biosynthesis polyprenyl glycosylphosphotransferase
MTRHQTAFFRQILVATDVLVSALAFLAALGLRERLAGLGLPSWTGLSELGPVAALPEYGTLLLGLAPIWAVTFHAVGTGAFRYGMGHTFGRYVRAVLVGLVVLVVVQFMLQLTFLSRSFVGLFVMLQLGGLMLARPAILAVVQGSRRRHDHRVLIVGRGQAAAAFARSLRDRSDWHNRLLGHVSVPGERPSHDALPHIGGVEDLADILDSQPVDEVVFAVTERDHPALQAAIEACDVRGVEVLLTMPTSLPAGGTVEVASVTGFDLPMIGFSRKPQAEGQLAVKRVLDLLGASILIVLAAPILIATALAIRIESRGPILFRQVRSGLGGRRFTMLKFRSMVVDAEARRRELEHLNEMNGPVFKIKSDPRVTRVGRFIRATSIDELPQLFTVILGHMSLVGPRPPLPTEVAEYEPWQRRRLSVRPGITGPWQVSGRNDVDFEQWMKLDLGYIDNWSIWLDLEILLRTVPAVVMRAGAS